MQALIAFWSHAFCAAAFLGLLIWRLGAIRQQDQRLLLAGFAVTACWAWLNAILPGAVDTPMLRAGLGRGHVGHGDMQERLDNLARKTVNGKVGKPAEIASAIYFLADNEQSSFMTGQALVVDGGATARLSTE